MNIRLNVSRAFLYIIILFPLVVQAQKSYGYMQAEEKLSWMKNIRTANGLENAKGFIRNDLDFPAIENTPMWKEYIQHWVAFYAQRGTSPDSFADNFVPQAKAVIDRIKGNNPKTAVHLSNDLIQFFDQYGLDDAAASVAAYAVDEIDAPESDFSVLIRRTLIASGLKKGAIAPSLSGLSDGVYKNTIIVFYETGCGNCDRELKLLADTYTQLKEQGYRIISVSGDLSEEVFQNNSKHFPWKDKLCDFNGFDGDSFKNYGIISTPVFYLTDNYGKVKGKYAKMKEIPTQKQN